MYDDNNGYSDNNTNNFSGNYSDGSDENYSEYIAAGYAEQNSPQYVQRPFSQKMHGKANIVVVGVGGAGCNAVNNMIRAGITSAQFVVMNTDLQALNMSQVEPQYKFQLGDSVTQGLGAGADPEVGRRAAEESRDRIKAALKGIDLLFITAGMGGGTGTGAAPVVASIAKSLGILTVAVVTKPFAFEGEIRRKNAEEGIKKLKEFVDTMLIIPNQRLCEVLDTSIPFKRAFEIADDVLRQGVQGVSDVIMHPQIINVDFADVRTVLSKRGFAHMGIGYGKGEKRIFDAVRNAVFCPLHEHDIQGATAVLINIIGPDDLSLQEVQLANNLIYDVVAKDALIILGYSTVAEKQEVEVTIIATGFDNNQNVESTDDKKNINDRLAEKYERSQRAASDIYFNNTMRDVAPQQQAQPQQQPQRVVPIRRNFSADQGEVRSSRIATPEPQLPSFMQKNYRNPDDPTTR